MDLNKVKKIFTHPSYFKVLLELKRLRDQTNGTILTTSLLGSVFKLTNGISFSFLYNEIFEDEIYRFESNHEKPLILDCGANIGVSILYFKKLYPLSKIIAFEPDPKIFGLLSENVKQANFSDVVLINKAIWDSESEISFYAEGGDAGRIAQMTDQSKLVKVPTTSLRPYLDKTIDLLKIDIEGAELVVLENISDLLYKVNNIFVEFHSFSDKPQQLSRLLAILENAGFRMHITTPGLKHPLPFIQKNKSLVFNMDMQLNIYGYRV